MVEVFEKFYVAITPRITRKIFVEVRASCHSDATQIAEREFMDNFDDAILQIHFNKENDYVETVIPYTEAQYERFILDADSKEKNKKENSTHEDHPCGHVAFGGGDIPAISKIPRVVALGKRKSIIKFSSNDIFDDVIPEEMGKRPLPNGFVDDDCEQEKKEVEMTPDEIIKFENLGEHQGHK